MALQLREHVVLLSTGLTTVSLALIFGSVLGAIPASLLPRAPGAVAVIPHVNVAISLVAIAAIVVGWRAIRNGRIRRHRAAMLSAAALFAAFLLLYLYKVVVEGTAPFPGPETIHQFVYLPLLAVHVGLAVVCVPLLYYVLLLGLLNPITDIPSTRHPGLGRIAAALWLTSFVLGIAVYLLLYVVY